MTYQSCFAMMNYESYFLMNHMSMTHNDRINKVRN